MKAKCIVDIDFFTKGKLYDVTEIDDDGDIWVAEDDVGLPFLLFQDECELVYE